MRVPLFGSGHGRANPGHIDIGRRVLEHVIHRLELDRQHVHQFVDLEVLGGHLGDDAFLSGKHQQPWKLTSDSGPWAPTST